MFRGAHEPLVGKALFDRVRRVLSGKQRLKMVKHDFIFRRLLTCTECTHALIGERQKGHVYYRCHSRECPMTGIREEAVEQSITEVFSPLFLTPEELEDITGKIHALRENWDGERDREMRAVMLELGNLRGRLDRLTDAYLDQMIDKQTFEERRTLLFEEKAIEDRMREITDGKHSLPDRLDKFLELIKALCCNYKMAIPEEKREILRSVTSNRAIGPQNVEIQLRSPFLELANRGIVHCGGHNRTVPRTLDGDFEGAASSPAQPDASSTGALFQTLVEWFKKNPEAFAPMANGPPDADYSFAEAPPSLSPFKKVRRAHNADLSKRAERKEVGL